MTLDDIDDLARQAARASGDLGRTIAVMPGKLMALCLLARERAEQLHGRQEAEDGEP